MSEDKEYMFFQHRKCEYFPCHSGLDPADFNCLFCYCPLYALGRDCGGSFSYDNKDGIKDCSRCTKPHERLAYGQITSGAKKLIEMVKEVK